MSERPTHSSRSAEMSLGERTRIADKMTAMAMVYCSSTLNVPKIKHHAVISGGGSIFQAVADIRGIGGSYSAVDVNPKTVHPVVEPLNPELFTAFWRRERYLIRPIRLRIIVICDEATGHVVRELPGAEVSRGVITARKKDGDSVVFFIEDDIRVQTVFERRAILLAR